jgi:esterase/lipase superfamily enzyme
MLLLLLSAGITAQAQAPARSVPPGCESVLPTAADDLAARGVELQRQEDALAQRRVVLAAAAGETSPDVQTVDAEIRRLKEEHLEIVFALECLRPDIRTEPVRGPEGQPPAWVEVTTYFGTNRAPTGATEPATFYGPTRTADLNLGRTLVSIPTSRRPGDMSLPSLWRFELSPDPTKHFIFKSVSPLALEAARQELALRLAGTQQRSVLLFVHGYNVSFADAALRTAQLSHDLGFSGLSIFFAWPSAATTKGYWKDEEMAELSEGALDRLLDEIGSLSPSSVYIIAHSMGNRLVTKVIQERLRRGISTGSLRELLLAAPDINEEIFRERIAPAIAAMQNVRRTIYASSNDLALKASKIVHGFRRVGDTTGGAAIFPGFETIDAARTAPTARAFGHSYVVDSAKVLGDIQDIITTGLGAEDRRLARQGLPPRIYWTLN